MDLSLKQDKHELLLEEEQTKNRALEKQIKQLQTDLATLTEKNEEQERSLRRIAKSTATKTDKLQEVASGLEAAQAELSKAAVNLQKKEEANARLKIKLAEKDLVLKETLEKFKREEKKIKLERAQMAKRKAQAAIEKSKEKASTVKQMKQKKIVKPESHDILKFKNKTSTLSKKIKSTQKEQTVLLEQFTEKLMNKDAELEQKDVELQAKDAELKEKEAEINAKEAEIESKDLEMAEKDKETQQLKEQVLNLQKQLAQASTKNTAMVSMNPRPVPSIDMRSGHRSLVNDKCTITKALFIGINYFGLGLDNGELRGCINDVRSELAALQGLGFSASPGVNVKCLTEKTINDHPLALPTRDNCIQAFKWLLHDVKEGDVLWLHYSGHGVQDSTVPSPERDGVNEAIQPLDYVTKGNIMDKVLRRMLVDTLPKGATLYAIMDCCHSGDILDMRYVFDEFTGKLESDPEIPPPSLGGDAILISGCMSTQESADLPSGAFSEALGALTTKMCEFYKVGYSWKHLVTKLRQDLSSCALNQVPQLESSRKYNVNARSFKKAFPTLRKYVPPKFSSRDEEKVQESARCGKAQRLAKRERRQVVAYESDHDDEFSDEKDEEDEYNELHGEQGGLKKDLFL